MADARCRRCEWQSAAREQHGAQRIVLARFLADWLSDAAPECVEQEGLGEGCAPPKHHGFTQNQHEPRTYPSSLPPAEDSAKEQMSYAI